MTSKLMDDLERGPTSGHDTQDSGDLVGKLILAGQEGETVKSLIQNTANQSAVTAKLGPVSYPYLADVVSLFGDDEKGTPARAKGERRVSLFGKVVSPLILRAQTYAEFVGALGTVIANDQKNAPKQSDAVEQNPRLLRFKADYDRFSPELKARCSWAKISHRLLADNGHYLKLAEVMNDGGVLFGVDAEGNPLIADGGDGPIMTGMDYRDTRDRVLHEYTGNRRIVTNDRNRYPIPTGYEMFPFSTDHLEKSTEIMMFEAHTDQPFIQSGGSHLESGANPQYSCSVLPGKDRKVSYLSYRHPDAKSADIGVRRLLRVKVIG